MATMMRRRASKDANGVGSRSASEQREEEEPRKAPRRSSSSQWPSPGESLVGLLILAVVFGGLCVPAFKAMFMHYVVPLAADAEPERFSEGRAMGHIWALAGEKVAGRQEGTPGLEQAADYIVGELEALKARAGPGITVEIDRSHVSGSFNLEILRHSQGFAYRNHTVVAARVAAKGAAEDAAAVLLNAHFDAPLGSPGASDCASCVASLLETFRQVIDTRWVPTAPVIFLFNGAEEIFLLATHGFITSHKWRASVGAIINVEASGACGPDLVVQSGPGSWPSRVYYESAVHPMANSVAREIFPLIPGDTDYRIFAQDFEDIPGLDTVWILKGAVYHTPYDRPEFIVPGALQARGDNLVSLVRGFAAAPELKGSRERARERETLKGRSPENRAMFYDIWGKWMVYYSRRVAVALHLLPLGIVALAPSLSTSSSSGLPTVGARVQYLLQGFGVQVTSILLGLLVPVALAVMRLLVASTALTWFSRQWIALCLFVPSSLAGSLLPRVLWVASKRRAGVQEEALEWGGHWGTVALSAVLSAVQTLVGIGGYLEFMWAFFLIPALPLSRLCSRIFGQQSLLGMVGYLLPASLPMAYSAYFSGILVVFIGEKAGMTGSLPLPFGFYVADVIMAALIGLAVVVCVGPVLPVVVRWIGTPHVVRLLLYTSIAAAALSSRAFPYSFESPKRLVLQHTVHTSGSEVVRANYDFASIDPNSVTLIWKHVPGVVESLNLTDAQLARDIDLDATTFTSLYPITRMLTRGASVPAAASSNPSRRYPHLLVTGEETHYSQKEETHRRRIHFELHVGSLQAIWGAVMNISGPLWSWSFAEQTLPAAEVIPGGPQSYICRLSGHSNQDVWQFWLDARGGALPLRIELSVLDQQLELEAESLAASFPPWVAVVAGTSYLSTYII